MKNRFLALMALCGATSLGSLWAQNWEDPTLTFVEPDLEGIQAGNKQVYYIYNVGSEMFLTNGANYGTQMSVKTTGQAVTISWGQDYVLVYKVGQADYSDAYGYRLSMMNAPTNGGFHELFITNEVCYVDHNAQGHMLWDIQSNGDGTYGIRVSPKDPTYGAEMNPDLYANRWAGAVATAGEDGSLTWNEAVTPLILQGSAGYEHVSLQWKFVEPDVYEVYNARKNELKPMLDSAVHVGFTDYAEYEAVYNNASATAAEISAAAEALSSALVSFQYDAQFGDASESNPADATFLITNPNFNENGSASSTGWATWRANSNNNFQAQVNRTDISTEDGFSFTDFFERWTSSSPHGNWYVQQELTGLPSGHYRLGARMMSNITAENGGPSGNFLFARTSMGEARVEHTTPSPDGGMYAYPYSVDFYVLDGTATIGVTSESYPGNWSGVGYFTLQFLGSATAADALATEIARIQNLYDNTISNLVHSSAADQMYEETLKAAQEAANNPNLSEEALQEQVAALQQAIVTLESDAAAYTALRPLINDLYSRWDNSDEFADADMPNYDKYLTSVESAYNGRTFDAAEIDSVQVRADRAWMADVANLLTSGETNNVTALLTNPDFSAGNTNGWTVSGASLAYGYGAAEVYQGSNYEIYQELTNLPAGSYEVSVQGFYRSTWYNDCAAAWGVEGDETNTVYAYLFGNDASTPMAHLLTVLLPDSIEGNGRFGHLTQGSVAGNYVPDVMQSAQYVISADPNNYKATTVCYVGSDGVLRVGIREGASSASGRWMLFDNLTVTYLGASDMSGAKSALDALVRDAQTLLQSESPTTTEAQDALNKAINEAIALTNLTEETYQAAVEALNAAIEGGNEAIEAATALQTRANDYDDKLMNDEYAQYADTDAFNDFYDLVANICDDVLADNLFASMAAIDEYQAQLAQAYTKMTSSMTTFTGASKDAPVDATSLIYNPSFQFENGLDENGEMTYVSSAEGWTCEGGKATSAYGYEIYNDSCAIYQTLYNMPAGYYTISYYGFYRAGTSQGCAEARLASLKGEEGEKQYAEVYIANGDNNWSKPLPSILEGVSERKYNSSCVFLNDTLFPDRPDMVYFLIVNNVAGAKAKFDEGTYADSFSFYVAEGETPVLGVGKTGHIASDWACFDDFKLMYLGDGDANKPEDFVSSVEEVLGQAAAEVVATQWYTINGVRVAEPTQRGIYIRQDVKADGSKVVSKVLVK